mmetsp:Transcript_22780/g.52025  ORF Transcript_22780/g.52025 Transcript_22780/m.52025 type:complete len:124 (+) Transcript_22780:1397-1768(+)
MSWMPLLRRKPTKHLSNRKGSNQRPLLVKGLEKMLHKKGVDTGIKVEKVRVSPRVVKIGALHQIVVEKVPTESSMVEKAGGVLTTEPLIVMGEPSETWTNGEESQPSQVEKAVGMWSVERSVQ